MSFFFASLALADVSFFDALAASDFFGSCSLESVLFASVAVASARAARRTRPVDDVSSTRLLGWREENLDDPARRSLCAPGATPARNASPPATIMPDIANDSALLVSMDEVNVRGDSASRSGEVPFA